MLSELFWGKAVFGLNTSNMAEKGIKPQLGDVAPGRAPSEAMGLGDIVIDKTTERSYGIIATLICCVLSVLIDICSQKAGLVSPALLELDVLFQFC